MFQMDQICFGWTADQPSQKTSCDHLAVLQKKDDKRREHNKDVSVNSLSLYIAVIKKKDLF
jgi:hypothetical protein